VITPSASQGGGSNLGSLRAAILGAALAAAAGSLGCQQELRRTTRSIDAALIAGDYAKAETLATEAATQFQKDEQDRLIYFMAAARTAQIAGSWERSDLWYRRAFDEIRPYLDEKAEAKVTEAVSTTVVNQTIRIYRGTPPERIMVCTLDSINDLERGDFDAARLKLNRARDFQQDAKSRFQSEVAKQQAGADAAWRKQGWSESAAEGAIAKVRKQQGNLPAQNGMAVLPNPFTSYLRAVFLLSTSADLGDRQNARADLRAVEEMIPGFAPAALDIALIDENPAAGTMPITWVFFLSGLAPYYDEFRLDIPIPVGPVNYVSAAFPVFKVREDALGAIEAASAGGAAQSVTLADIDAMVRAEFDARLPTIVTQEVISSATKAAATYAASSAAAQSDSTVGLLVQIAGIAYQAASTAADLRCWGEMPKRIDLLRLQTPDNGHIELRRPGGAPLCSVSVQPKSPSIVFVTMPSAGAPPVVQRVLLPEAAAPTPQAIAAPRTISPSADSGSQPPAKVELDPEPEPKPEVKPDLKLAP